MRRVYEPDAAQIEVLRERAFRQKQNKYTPLVNVNVRGFVEAAPRNRNNNTTRAATFQNDDDAPPPIEVSENPIYLQSLQDDAMYTKAGQPFHPVYPGSTKELATTASSSTTMMRTIQHTSNNHNDTESSRRRPVSSPASTTRSSTGLTKRRNNNNNTNNLFDELLGSKISSGSFYHEAVGELQNRDRNFIVDPFAKIQIQNNNDDESMDNNNALRQLQYQIAKEKRERQQREMQELAEQQASVHQQHTIRHSCSDAVQVIRSLLYFRGVDTNAREGPHNAVTSRFMSTEFLQDVQWLLKTGATFIRYPSAGAGGAPHLRHFTIWMMPWAPGPKEAPVMSPFLVWLNDKKSTNAVGKAPLCNLLGVTKNANESVVLRRYVSHDGTKVKGPPMSANKKIELPVQHCASLWFLCYVTGEMASHAQGLDFEQSKKAEANLAGSTNNNKNNAGLSSSSSYGNLDAETAAARGLIPTSSLVNNNDGSSSSTFQQQSNRARQSLSSPPKLRPGSLGRINVDIAALQYKELLRFVKVIEGLASVNEVLVKRGGRR